MNDFECVRTLRRRWKPFKAQLGNGDGSHPTLIRFHRACSWVARVEIMDEEKDADLALVSLWVAFNSLYGQWNRTKREPCPDRECWRTFVDRILRLDGSHHLIDSLQTHKRLVMSLLEDEFLSTSYWKDPHIRRNGHTRKMKSTAQTWYIAERWTMILDELLDRIYLMRCQLAHGAATYGGKLNRTSLKHCVYMLRRLLPAILSAWIDGGADQDWGPMCYPPLNSQRTATKGFRPKVAK
jgi:hypothetical protein